MRGAAAWPLLGGVVVEMRTPDVPQLREAVEVFRGWPRDDAPFQLHPGDLGWAWRFGAEETAAATRTWWRDGDLVAIGAVDPDLLRLAMSPEALRDDELARQVVADVAEPGRGVLVEATVYVEAPHGSLLEDGAPVAAITVWSAGPGRPGLIEPMGVHRDHRGRGHGRAITLAGAAALRKLGSSSAVVCTPSSNLGGVATYLAAGFEPLAEVRDQRRSS